MERAFWSARDVLLLRYLSQVCHLRMVAVRKVQVPDARPGRTSAGEKVHFKHLWIRFMHCGGLCIGVEFTCTYEMHCRTALGPCSARHMTGLHFCFTCALSYCSAGSRNACASCFQMLGSESLGARSQRVFWHLVFPTVLFNQALSLLSWTHHLVAVAY